MSRTPPFPMLRAIVFFFLAIASVAGPSMAQSPATGRTAEPAYTIPFELYDNRIYLQVSGAGFGPRWFLLDTGAQVTHFTSELVGTAGLRTAGRVGISGTGAARIRGAYVAPTRLTIGRLQLPVRRGVSAPAEALFGPVYSGTGRRFDGVLGYDLFAAYVVQIDYAGRQLRLYQSGRQPTSPTAAALPIRIVDKKPYLTGLLEVGGRAMTSNLHLDTGFGGAVSLNGNFVTAQGLVELAGPTLESSIRGVGGVTQSRTARFDALTLGGLRIARPLVGLALAQGAGVRGDSAGRIGGELLRRFTVTLDYRSRTVRLDPTEDLLKPFEVDMSGLGFVPEGTSGIVVLRVAEGTPGAEAGVQPGDRLIAIDGVPVSAGTLEDVRGLLRREGEERELLLQRGDQQIRTRLTLRRRI